MVKPNLLDSLQNNSNSISNRSTTIVNPNTGKPINPNATGAPVDLTRQQTNPDTSSNGFKPNPIPAADSNGLPSNKVSSERSAKNVRNIMHWFIPEFGIVKMYVNPEQVSYNHKKNIYKDNTKGGFVLQYWGEELSTLNLSGTTGSSGIEGINVLYEAYRAEQYAFDTVGVSLAANNAQFGAAQQMIQGLSNAVGNTISNGQNTLLSNLGNNATSAAFGQDFINNNLAPRNIPTLASLAFGVELYYSGWVFRGYFENMTITEAANNFLLQYNINFVITQRRGYRLNYLPFHKSAIDGPSNHDAVPNTFYKLGQ